MLLVYELKKEDPSGIRDKILYEITIADLNKDEGMKTYMDFMNKHFKKDQSVATYEAYLNFEKCKKNENEDIKTFVMRFDKQSNIAKKKNVKYPNLVLAFKLLDNSGLSEVDRKLVLSEMDFTKENEVYDDTKKALLKYKSEGVCSRNANSIKSEYQIKLEESAMIAKSADDIEGLEMALVAAGWSKPRSSSNPDSGSSRWNSSWNSRGRGNGGRFNGSYTKYNSKNKNMSQDQQSGRNPKKNGEYLRCFSCDSIFHMKHQCPLQNRLQPQ